MCEYCLISGAISFLVGLGLGTLLKRSNKKCEEPVIDDHIEDPYVVRIKING